MISENQTSKNQQPAYNADLALIFHKMSDCYKYLGQKERFRAVAYENAAKVLNNMTEDISVYGADMKKLDQIGYIGKSIAEKIVEYQKTGKIKAFEKLQKKVPFHLLELMDISGFGPSTLRILHDHFHLDSREQLLRALQEGRIRELRGFGEKKIENMKRALKLLKPPQRMNLQDARKIAEKLLQLIRQVPGVQKTEIAGSIRRKKSTIGDIDIIIQANLTKRMSIVNQIAALPFVGKVLGKGTTKLSVLIHPGDIQLDIRLVAGHEFGAAMLYFTGSKEHCIKLRTIAREQGFKINEYGLFDLQTQKRLAGATEEQIYHALHLKFIPPEMRLDQGEIEAARIR